MYSLLLITVFTIIKLVYFKYLQSWSWLCLWSKGKHKNVKVFKVPLKFPQELWLKSSRGRPRSQPTLRCSLLNRLLNFQTLFSRSCVYLDKATRVTFHVPLGPVNNTALKFTKMKNLISEQVCETDESKMPYWPRNQNLKTHSTRKPSGSISKCFHL